MSPPPTSPPSETERSEQAEAAEALRAFLAPRSVAVIGASRTPGSIGSEIFRNLIFTGFQGPAYPVNPKATFVHSVPCHPSILDVPGPVDLAIVVVPATHVIEAARQCAEKGVRALVVISAGFAEVGGAGVERQRELLRICKNSGMRLIGPNCMGILNTAEAVRLNASFTPTWPPRGRVGMLSQSGALGLAVIDHARTLGLGLSSFVSVGNKADVSSNDLLLYWASDPDTDLVLLYLESFGNPRRFARLARRISREKPIVAVKSGRSVAGARATGSHTGALLRTSDATVDALFEQAGVIRTDTLNEMFDVAMLLANQPLPEGRRVAILTNAGGPAILCADTCEHVGLQVATLPADVQRKLGSFLPSEAALHNPVDMTAGGTAEAYRRAIEVLGACEEIDALIVIFIPPLATQAAEVSLVIREAAKRIPRRLPVLGVFMSMHGIPGDPGDQGARVPSFMFPEDAARALSRIVQYARWREREEGRVVQPIDIRPDVAAAVIEEAIGNEPRWLSVDQVGRLLGAYGLPVAETRLAETPGEAQEAASALGGEVALKAVVAGLTHKTDVGAVRLGLAPKEVSDAARTMCDQLATLGHQCSSFIVQRMIPSGVETLIGVVHDPAFGPVLAVGAGGTAVELIQDLRVRITPITDRDADEMIRSLRTYPMLNGYRGAPRADVDALKDLLLRVGSLVERHPELAEMDLNPVMVLTEGAVIVDARVRLAPRAPSPS